MPYNREQLTEYARAHMDIGDECDVLKADSDIVEFLLDHCEITVPEENRFFVKVNCAEIQRAIVYERARQYDRELRDAGLLLQEEVKASTGCYDFSHTTTDWNFLLTHGILGIRDRIRTYAAQNGNHPKRARFYAHTERVYNAALRFIQRAGEAARIAGKAEMALGLENLSKAAPQNLYEAMQTIIIYYVLQHMVEGSYLRTLGRLDILLYPFYLKETEQEGKQLVCDFLKEIDTLEAPSNIPFALGGTDTEGNSAVNELSYILLEAYDTVPTSNTKFHLVCAKNTPADLVRKTLECVRRGNNSVVFMSEEKLIESLEKLGESHEDAADYHIVGCYESGGRQELCSSTNGRINLVKALELAMNKGQDMMTGYKIGLENDGVFEDFEGLFQEFIRQARYLCACAIKATNIYEKHYSQIHSAPILSPTYLSALEKGGDLYCDYAAKYNNSSANALGLGTVVDSLAAIRKLVYEDGTMSLQELTDILMANWEGQEQLRLLIKNKFPKFGTGDAKTDALASDIIDELYQVINHKPNVKGGVYRLGAFSIDWRWEFGEKTAASADGRLCGETLSQNTSATFGADREGATAHMLSLTAIDGSKLPNGCIVDIDLHSSAVKGENGLNTLVATLNTYFELGGFAVHYNVLDTETLKQAKENPRMYPNLQVRLCGWNVLFSSLTDQEKDEFIARAECK